VGDHVERIRLGFEAFNRRDFDELVALCAPDVEWTPPADLPGSRTYHGHEGVRAALADMIEVFPNLQAEVGHFSDEGGRVVALYLWHGTVPGSASTDLFEVRAGGICDFDDDDRIKTARFWTTWEETEATAEKERARQKAGP
jgi:steroid delta-isomerase-like uncharacterized protein